MDTQTKWTLILVIASIQYALVYAFPTLEGYSGWLLFAFLLGRVMGLEHPEVSGYRSLNTSRKILGWIGIIIFLLCFTPQPFQISWNSKNYLISFLRGFQITFSFCKFEFHPSLCYHLLYRLVCLPKNQSKAFPWLWRQPYFGGSPVHVPSICSSKKASIRLGSFVRDYCWRGLFWWYMPSPEKIQMPSKSGKPQKMRFNYCSSASLVWWLYNTPISTASTCPMQRQQQSYNI